MFSARFKSCVHHRQRSWVNLSWAGFLSVELVDISDSDHLEELQNLDFLESFGCVLIFDFSKSDKRLENCGILDWKNFGTEWKCQLFSEVDDNDFWYCLNVLISDAIQARYFPLSVPMAFPSWKQLPNPKYLSLRFLTTLFALRSLERKIAVLVNTHIDLWLLTGEATLGESRTEYGFSKNQQRWLAA